MRIRINGFEVEGTVDQLKELLSNPEHETSIKINANDGTGNVLTKTKGDE